MIKLNEEVLKVELYGSKFKINLFGALYTDGNFAVIAFDEEGDEFATVTVNVVELRKSGVIKQNQVVINHDLMGDEYLPQILEVLTDKEPEFVTYGMASSIAIELKDEIIDKLLEIDYE